MKIKKFIYQFILGITFIFMLNISVLADKPDEKITFIYISGILATNPTTFEHDVRALHKYFANQKMGKYTVDPDYKIVLWGADARNGSAYQIFQEGLIATNSQHNKSKCKKTSASRISLLFNPINSFLVPGDSGSSAQAVYWRNYIHNHFYDVTWFFLNKHNRDRIYDQIQEKIKETDNKYVLVGNSFGSVIAVNFVLNNILQDTVTEKSYQDKFLGILTSSDPSNTVYSSVLSEQNSPDKPELKGTDFNRYFIENDKFWISLNHRNDIISTGLAPAITSNNVQGNGFIIFDTNKTSPLKNFCQLFVFWDRRDGLLKSHNWCFNRPENFAQNILRIYRENERR